MKPGRQERGASFPARKVSGHSGRNPCRASRIFGHVLTPQWMFAPLGFFVMHKNGQGMGELPIAFSAALVYHKGTKGWREGIICKGTESIFATGGRRRLPDYPTLPKFSPRPHPHSHTHCRAHTTAQNTFSPKQSPPHQPTTARQSPPHSKENTAPAKS